MDDACPTTGGKRVCTNAESKINLIWEKNIWRRREVSEHQPFIYLLLSKEISIDDMILL
jgi:hypothetical protein